MEIEFTEENENFYLEEEIEEMLFNDEIAPEEAAFMLGYINS